MTIGANGPGIVVLGASDRAAACAAVKALLRIETAGEDALVTGFAEAALGLAERFTGQVLIARTMAATLRTRHGWQVLGAIPVRAIGAVAATRADGTGATLSIGDYAVDIDADGAGWLRVSASGYVSATASFTAGLADDWAGLPAPIRQGAAMLAAHLFTTRDYSEREGGAAPPAAVTALWRPFRTVRIAAEKRA